jgi:pimeloyl-ACP methyl ester carboxylesterase
MGGRIALELARRNRVSRLALFGPVGFGDVPPARELAPFLPNIPGSLAKMFVPRELVELVQRRVYGKIGWFTERDIDEYWAPTQSPAVVQACLQMLREFDWRRLSPEALAQVTSPTLIVFGTLDATVKPVNVVELVKALPHGRLEWIEGGGHVVMEEVPDAVNRLLLDFLRERAEAR